MGAKRRFFWFVLLFPPMPLVFRDCTYRPLLGREEKVEHKTCRSLNKFVGNKSSAEIGNQVFQSNQIKSLKYLFFFSERGLWNCSGVVSLLRSPALAPNRLCSVLFSVSNNLFCCFFFHSLSLFLSGYAPGREDPPPPPFCHYALSTLFTFPLPPSPPLRFLTSGHE